MFQKSDLLPELPMDLTADLCVGFLVPGPTAGLDEAGPEGVAETDLISNTISLDNRYFCLIHFICNIYGQRKLR